MNQETARIYVRTIFCKKKNRLYLFIYLLIANALLAYAQDSNRLSSEQANTKRLNDIVVTGYTIQDKSSITGSVSVISNSRLQDAATPNISSLLQSKAPGVQVTHSSGQPGALPAIRIRGSSTLNGNVSPLWVIDGAIMADEPTVNPNDIESISILKDASATSLYGSRGSNGVVVVTTKEADAHSKKLYVSAKAGATRLNQGNFQLMNARQLYNLYQSMGNQSRLPAFFNDELLQKDFNWFKNGAQTGIAQDYYIGYSSGSDKNKLFISGGYYNETGAVKGYDYRRYFFRINVDHKINKVITIKPKLAMTYTKTHDQQHDLYEMYRNLPWDNPYSNGSIVFPLDPEVTWYGRDQSNYLYDLQWNYEDRSSLYGIGILAAEAKLTKHLKFVSNNAITWRYSASSAYVDPRSSSGIATEGSLTENTATIAAIFTNQMLRFNHAWKRNSLVALAAYEYNTYTNKNLSVKSIGLIPGRKVLSAAASPNTTSGNINEYAIQSVLFNAEYGYDNRYYAQASLRTDGASNFGENNQYALFYSVSVSWNMHNERFFQRLKNAITTAKFRASYGSVGNRPDDFYPHYSLYNATSNYNAMPAPLPKQLGNPDLTWEKSYQTNVALNLEFIDKIELVIDYYNKNTSGLLYFVPLPATTGYSGYWSNVGRLTNEGIEISFDAQILNKKNWQWEVGFNVGYNANVVNELYKGQPIDRTGEIKRTAENSNINTWYMRKWAGVDPENGDPLWEAIDANGNKSVTSNYSSAALQKSGQSTPDYFGGIHTKFTFKGAYISAGLFFSVGNQIYNQSRETYDADGAYFTYNQQALRDDWSRWNKPGDIATHPRPYFGGNKNSQKPSARYLENGSYLRIRNITIGYALPISLLNKIKIKRADIFCSFENIFTIADFSGMDPEVGYDGLYNSLYPVPIRLVIGLNVTL